MNVLNCCYINTVNLNKKRYVGINYINIVTQFDTKQNDETHQKTHYYIILFEYVQYII